MRIGLNLLHAVPEIGGGWNYIANLLAAIAGEPDGHEFVAFVNPSSAALVPQSPHFRAVPIAIDARVRARRVLYEHTALQLRARRERLDCLHWFANAQGLLNAAPAVVTVYDLQPFVPWGQLSRAKREALRWQLRHAARRAAMLLPMSASTAAGLQSVLGVEARRMTVIPPVLEAMFAVPEAQAIAECRRRHRLPERFWLYVAHGYVHKNHVRLLEAYRELKGTAAGDWPLVLRGDPQPDGPDIAALARRFGIEKDVVMLPSVRREELPALYGAATMLVFASVYEGAGIPVLEAQACGCPVVAADIPPVREFAADAASYFDPHSAADIRRAMIAIAADAAARERLRAAGLERAKAFRLRPVVRDLLSAYDRAIHGNAARTTTDGRP